jgi:site-specific DNA-cytosine methylase
MPPAATRTMASPSNEDRSDQDAFVGEWIDKYFVELDEVYRGRIVSQSAHSTNTHTNSNTDTHTSALWKVYYPADPTKSYPDSDVEELDWDEVQTGIALYRQRNGKEKENGKTKTFATRTSPRTPSSNQATSPRTFVSSATSTSISTTSASSTSSTTTTSSTTSLPKVRRTSRRRSVTQSSYRDEASVESADDETYRTARRSPRTRTSPPRALDAQLAVEPPSKRSRTAVSRSTTRRSSPTSSRSTALPCAFAVLMGARPAPRKARTAKDSVANAPSHHPSSAPEHGPLPVPPTRTQTQTPTTSHAVEGNPMADGSRFVKKPYTAGDDLPVLAQPHAMFDDLVANLTDHGRNIHVLWPLVETFRSRTLRVATMCSGTEAPVLALDLLQTSLRHALRRHAADELRTRGIDVANVLRIEHVFSCEIEPFKQAYIERNFRPPLLFRDIRELGQPQAYTAYGALRDVPNRPGCVDVLVAGTSCVDYSNLNNQKKHIDQKGESGQTFHGMMDWVDLAQPPIVIIENVSGAPWEIKVKMFEERGYAATFLRIDTKEYYIPQTRKRGYLFAIKAQTKNKVVDRPARWTAAVKSLKRPASAALDDFMLPNDDPRVLRGRARLTAESSAGEGEGRTRTVDWTKCETNHQQARSMEELGDKRPLTNWSDSGNTAMPSFGWNEWTNAQVHRIHDLMDINALRLAKLMIDCSHKTMVWNLSQNVHRDTMGVLGLSQCLTPTGVFYVANRGGPLVGEELLMLQGIPAEDLLLTKESEANLKVSRRWKCVAFCRSTLDFTVNVCTFVLRILPATE